MKLFKPEKTVSNPDTNKKDDDNCTLKIEPKETKAVDERHEEENKYFDRLREICCTV